MNFNDNKAIYLQIVDRICDEILSGKYAKDERIPSVREYASIVEVNANTVMRSYDYLQSNEIIYNKRGIGYFVSPNALDLIVRIRKEQFLNNEINYLFKQLKSVGIDSAELCAMYEKYCKEQ